MKGNNQAESLQLETVPLGLHKQGMPFDNQGLPIAKVSVLFLKFFYQRISELSPAKKKN